MSTSGALTGGSTATSFVTNGEATPIVMGDAVYKDAVTETVLLADASVLLTSRVVGVVLEASIPAGDTGRLLTEGRLDGIVSGFTPGGLVYLSLTGTSGGTLTQTAPSGTTEAVVRIGTAITATDVLIEIRDPLEL